MPRKGEILPKPQVGDPSDPHGFAVMRDAYIESLRVQNYSERTVENRISYLNALIIWCEERSLARPSEITKPILERYQRHLLHMRHACATLMLENGADIRFIQAMPGHAKFETTEICTHVSIRQLKAIHESTHPTRMHSEDAQELRSEIEEMQEEETTGLMDDSL